MTVSLRVPWRAGSALNEGRSMMVSFGYDHDQIEEFEEAADEAAEKSARAFAGGMPTAQDLTGGGDVDAEAMSQLATQLADLL